MGVGLLAFPYADCSLFFFFNDTATTEIYTLSLHDALPIFCAVDAVDEDRRGARNALGDRDLHHRVVRRVGDERSEEHTSELQSQSNLVCRLLLEKKKKDARRVRLLTKENNTERCTRERYTK